MSNKTILLIILLLNIPNTTTADIYKWTDEQGTVHFSDSTNSLPGDAQKIHAQQIPEKTKEQREKELNEQVKKVKEESKKGIDEMFSVANEGLISIRNGLITLGVTIISIEFLILYFKKKRRNWNKD